MVIFNTKIHTSCSQPIGPGLKSGDFEVIEGYSRNGGLICPLDGNGGGDDDCGECKGKVSELTLRYDGGIVDAHIKVVQKKNSISVFDGTVQPGGEFGFVGVDKKGTLGTEISIYVDDVLNTKIHTSCSQPIGPGLVSGDFAVITGFSKNNGVLCSTDGTQDPDEPDGHVGCCDGKVTRAYLAVPWHFSCAYRSGTEEKICYCFF